MKKKVFDTIASLRLAKGLSKADMARYCSITPTAYANIEKGEMNSISLDIAKAISNALEVSFNELFEIETQNDNAEQIEKFRDEIKNLKKQIDDKSLLIDLLLKEKEIFKRTAIISIIENADSELTNIDQEIANATTEEQKNELFYRRAFIASNKQAMLDRFINFGYFEQIDIDNFYKDLNAHYDRMGKYGYSRLGIKTDFKE